MPTTGFTQQEVPPAPGTLEIQNSGRVLSRNGVSLSCWRENFLVPPAADTFGTLNISATSPSLEKFDLDNDKDSSYEEKHRTLQEEHEQAAAGWRRTVFLDWWVSDWTSTFFFFRSRHPIRDDGQQNIVTFFLTSRCC